MSETRTQYQAGQKAQAGGSNSHTPGVTGTTGGASVATANTSVEAAPMARKPRSTRAAKPTVEQALAVTQDIVRLAIEAGITAYIVNLSGGDAAIVLHSVHYCTTCHNLSMGAECQKCAGQNTQ